jgi:hypothetical protein
MYHDKMLSIAKIANGYLLEIRAPYKRKEKDAEEDDRGTCLAAGMDYGEKEVFAKDAADLGKKIELLMPMLDEEFASEGEFEAAFKMMK